MIHCEGKQLKNIKTIPLTDFYWISDFKNRTVEINQKRFPCQRRQSFRATPTFYVITIGQWLFKSLCLSKWQTVSNCKMAWFLTWFGSEWHHNSSFFDFNWSCPASASPNVQWSHLYVNSESLISLVTFLHLHWSKQTIALAWFLGFQQWCSLETHWRAWWVSSQRKVSVQPSFAVLQKQLSWDRMRLMPWEIKSLYYSNCINDGPPARGSWSVISPVSFHSTRWHFKQHAALACFISANVLWKLEVFF